ncbi:MAG: YtpR family tRNA-binding protein, partial [Gemmatimonadaceae bacterium]
MNASYDWLRSLVPVTMSPAELRDLITAHTATVDELVPLRADLNDVVIGLVVEAAPHPDSDHLWVTKVDAGTGELIDVVCGAANVRAGKKYPFAPSGTTLPGGMKLERRKIRGAVSNGMLCSARELALGDEHEGILELDTPAPPGTPFLRAPLRSLVAGDTRLVIDVGANRADLHSHLGIAREIAAVSGLEAGLPAIAPGGAPPLPPRSNGSVSTVQRPVQRPRAPGSHEKHTSGVTGGVAVELRHVVGCHHYSGVVLRGVSVGPSPRWLVERLAAVGARSINNVVDVTNYMVHEVGQPMHAFDLGKLDGPAVIVRAALPGEKLTTLDGVERALDPSMTVIADASRAQGVAGVIGGQESEVSEGTTDVFLEVATFDRASVRRTRRALGLSTDASYRFERGTDWAAAGRWLERAVELLRSVAGGEVAGEPLHLHAGTLHPAPDVLLRVSRVAHLLGVEVPREEVLALLRSVGFAIEERGADHLTVSVPIWRYDIAREVDLIEEVA